MPVETRYFRSDTQTVNGLTAYILGTAESSSLKELEIQSDKTVYIGIRVWKRNSAGSETEITSGSAGCKATRNMADYSRRLSNLGLAISVIFESCLLRLSGNVRCFCLLCLWNSLSLPNCL